MRSRSTYLLSAVFALSAILAAQQQASPDAPSQSAPSQQNQDVFRSKPNAIPSTPSQPAAKPDANAPTKPDASAETKPAGPIIPAAAERHYRQGLMNQRDGDLRAAALEYRAAIQEYPDYFDARYRLASLLLDQKGYAEAIAQLRQAALLKPDNADVRNDLGFAYKKNGDAKAAEAEYREAIRINPKLASAYSNLGNLLYARRDYTGAIQEYRAALKLQPGNADIHMNLGTVLDVTGRSEEAINSYKEAIKLQPKNANAHYNLAIAYKNKKDLTSAITELKAASHLAPDWPLPHIVLMDILKTSDPKSAYTECVLADGLTHDAKLHDECIELQKKAQ